MATKKKQAGGQKGRVGPRPAVPLVFDPFTPGREHPEWVRKVFPDYVAHQHEDLVRSVRTIEHGGSTITITTTYEVKIDGRLLTLHMMVDEQGQLWSHLCPYQSFGSAVDLVRHLLKRMPHLFNGGGGGEHEHEHEHGEHAAHEHGGGR